VRVFLSPLLDICCPSTNREKGKGKYTERSQSLGQTEIEGSPYFEHFRFISQQFSIV
jgi:hypothetical protein